MMMEKTITRGIAKFFRADFSFVTLSWIGAIEIWNFLDTWKLAYRLADFLHIN